MLTIVQTPDDLQTTFDACRALKVERLSGIRHLGGQLIDDILAMARQKALDTLDVLGIVCRGNHADTRTRAAPDMVVKAGAPVCAQSILTMSSSPLWDSTIRRQRRHSAQDAEQMGITLRSVSIVSRARGYRYKVQNKRVPGL